MSESLHQVLIAAVVIALAAVTIAFVAILFLLVRRVVIRLLDPMPLEDFSWENQRPFIQSRYYHPFGFTTNYTYRKTTINETDVADSDLVEEIDSAFAEVSEQLSATSAAMGRFSERMTNISRKVTERRKAGAKKEDS